MNLACGDKARLGTLPGPPGGPRGRCSTGSGAGGTAPAVDETPPPPRETARPLLLETSGNSWGNTGEGLPRSSVYKTARALTKGRQTCISKGSSPQASQRQDRTCLAVRGCGVGGLEATRVPPSESAHTAQGPPKEAACGSALRRADSICETTRRLISSLSCHLRLILADGSFHRPFPRFRLWSDHANAGHSLTDAWRRPLTAAD